MKTDIEIAQSVDLQPIADVVKKVGIDYDNLELYGKYKAKLSFNKIQELQKNPVGKLILVTAIDYYHWFSRRSQQNRQENHDCDS